jgi:hypothetical protein
MPCKWNDQWWSLVKSEKYKGEQRQRTAKKAKRVVARKRKVSE